MTTRQGAIRSARRRRGPQYLGCALWLAVAACSGGNTATDTIDRDTFVRTYVDLRVAALESDSQLLGDGQRVEVLERNGVTAQELLRFAEVHGRDLQFMRDVWNDVELRLDELRPEPVGR